MLRDFIEAAEELSSFSVVCFDGALIVRGARLSPVDAQAVGLASSLISVDLMNATEDNLGELAQVSKTIADEHHVMNEDELHEALKRLKRINPDKLRLIGEHQSKIICQCISEASIDGGETWEAIKVVMHKEQQSAAESRLWVGIFNTEDRIAIIDVLMSDHTEAAEKLKTFRR